MDVVYKSDFFFLVHNAQNVQIDDGLGFSCSVVFKFIAISK